MRIDDRDVSVSVLMLTLPEQEGPSLEAIEALAESIEAGVTLSVLVNGGSCAGLQSRISALKWASYYESESNLGVAGGRNFLLRTDECRGSDVVLVLDNDVIVPSDYVRSLVSFLLNHENAGVVGAAAADLAGGIGLDVVRQYGHIGVFGNRIFRITSKDIKSSVLSCLLPERLFHIGMDPNYRYAYFSILPGVLGYVAALLSLAGLRLGVSPVLRENSRYLELLAKGVDELRVSNVAGCSQAFRRALVDETGYMDERLNPYGFEDVDFCIRAMKAGYANYIDTNTWLFHGTDLRAGGRDQLELLENKFRCLTILASSHVSGRMRPRAVIAKLAFASFVAEAATLNRGAFKRLRARSRGFGRGLIAVAGRPREE